MLNQSFSLNRNANDKESTTIIAKTQTIITKLKKENNE